MIDQNAYNRQIIEEFRASRAHDGATMNGRPILLLTTIGAKSGKPHTTPVMFFSDGDRFIVLASNNGAPSDPDWYRNLSVNPEVTFEVGKETINGIAITAENEERARLWTRALVAGPFFAEHQAKIIRKIPVVILARRSNYMQPARPDS